MKMSIKSIMKYISVNSDKNNKKKHLSQATIIPILILSDKTVISLSLGD